jgi:site-specific recombinase XerD
MTELRRRMDDDMLARGLADRTRESYLWAVTGLARCYHRSPDQISDVEIQAYLVHLLRDRQRSWSTCNIVLNGLRFLYHTTLQRDRTTFSIPAPRHSGKLPVVLSRDEVQRLITATPNLRQRTMLLTTYAAGLPSRLSETSSVTQGISVRRRCCSGRRSQAIFIEEQKISVAPRETTAKRSQASVGGDGNRGLRCLFRPITSDETLAVSRK